MEKTVLRLSDLIQRNMFEVSEGECLIVSDPCYDIEDIEYNQEREINHRIKAKPGIWTYSFDEETRTLEVYEIQSANLVRDEGMNPDKFDNIVHSGVDSGQIGVFLEKHYNNSYLLEGIEFDYNKFENMNDDVWYRACCEATCSEYKMGFVPSGFVMSTRYGDGVYPVGLKCFGNTDEVAFIRIMTDDICEYCYKVRSYRGGCECELCGDCGESIDYCCCDDYYNCNSCGELIEDCACDDNFDE